MTPEDRRASVRRARDLFNTGAYWEAHEALETVWRSIISDGNRDAARVWQGLIQAAAALLHRRRGNRHGVAVVGAVARKAGRRSAVRRGVRNRAVPSGPGTGARGRSRAAATRVADGGLRTDDSQRT